MTTRHSFKLSIEDTAASDRCADAATDPSTASVRCPARGRATYTAPPAVVYGFDGLSPITDKSAAAATYSVGRLTRLESAPVETDLEKIAEGRLIDQAGDTLAIGEIDWALAGSAYPYLFTGRRPQHRSHSPALKSSSSKLARTRTAPCGGRHVT